ncbi:PEP-utilizing enzyme [Nanoarchaeota archaeon]
MGTNWKHMVTRRLAVQMAIAWNYGFGSLFDSKYGTSINNTLVYYNGKKTDYFVDGEEEEKFHSDLDSFLDDPKFVKTLIPEAKQFVEKQYSFINELIQDAFKLSDSQLAQLFSEVSMQHANYYTRMWMVFRICERIIMKIESLLKNTIKDNAKVKNLSRIFSIPLEPNDVTNERIDMLKIALAQTEWTDSKLQETMQKHTAKYCHIPMFDFDHEPYTIEHFAKELKAIDRPEKELECIEKAFSERRKEYKEIISKLHDKTLLNLIEMLKQAVFLRDHRDMIRQKLNLSLKGFYEAIASRLGLNVGEVALLINQEIIENLSDSSHFSKKDVEKRKEAFLLIQLGNKIEIYSGKNATKKSDELQIHKMNKQVSEIRGRAASPGKVKGIAKIVNTNLDFGKVNDGDILIVAMTRQDFVPVIRRASAIVTNEGGVTCHAAIIAREIGLPCVVGTEIATEALKDNDLIEVDGDKGIIRKVKK